ncbi:hypothetical protein ABZ845_24425 [Streptomyces sp. NPDC047022]|uniref:hypothetical protein n=1 Tax=Streptomyces sp. NPDC047022 TaxID=3155737 RepID=UPI0033DFAD3C
MIEPEDIPLFTGDLGQLDNHVRALRCHADDIRQAGGDADRRFHGLSAFYQAPEADALFASTAPARDAADSFADKVATVADALSDYAIEVAPIIKRLEALKSRAAAFVASLPAGHDQYGMDWTHDADKVHEDRALMHEVNVAQAQFAAAEVACNNKITALVGGTQYVINTGSRQLKPIGAKFYGYSPDVLDHAKELPWGTPVSQSHTLLDPHDYGYYLKSFVWDGLIVDNVWGTFDGFSALFGANGPQAFKDSWKGMFRAVVGAQAYLMDSGGRKPASATHDDYIQGSKAYAKEFAKSLVAWDQWKENPARAAATVVFNGLTLGAGPLKVASAGKAGTAAKAAATVAKIGEAIDPVNATTKVAGRAIPKIAEVTANLRGANRIPELRGPHSVLQLSDGSKLVIEDGRFIAYDEHGHVIGLGSDGMSEARPSVHEPASADRAVDSSSGEHELVGASARTGEAGGTIGDSTLPQAGHNAGDTSSRGEDAAHGGHGHSSESAGGHGPEYAGAGGRGGNAGGDWPDGQNHGHGAGGDHVGADGNPPAALHGALPDGEGRPMARGGEAEQRVRDAVKGIPGKKRPKPNVLDRVMERLSTEPDGQRVAEIIGSGQFNRSDEYGQVVSSLGANKAQMFQPGADQLIFADDLVKSGVPAHAIDFEQKYPVGADMDIRIADDSGDVYAYQMKHLNDPQDPVGEVTRGKYLLQLALAEADHHILLVDGGRGTRADWMSNGSYDALMDIHCGGRGPKGEGITFVIRLEDGNLVIPPGSKLDPKDML